MTTRSRYRTHTYTHGVNALCMYGLSQSDDLSPCGRIPGLQTPQRSGTGHTSVTGVMPNRTDDRSGGHHAFLIQQKINFICPGVSINQHVGRGW